ncbi:MAG: hypothetical protein HZA91_08615 [Verrucomicrobia bacterium]|nr:hypothetical protein [Verrucomicrobiota bacterium]
MDNLPVAQQASLPINTTVDSYDKGLVSYLSSLGLPTDKVLVPVQERGKVLLNLPDVVRQLPVTGIVDAHYVSKFVAACGAGLFDAALNFIWDETVKNLRKKVASFDLEYFFKSAITDPDRLKKLQTEEDLQKIEDWELIRGCHLTGILSDIGFRHLDYIRNMRNWASAAHPNQNELTGLQLVSWLETCIREVIAREPSGLVIIVRQLLENIRNHTLAAGDVPPISENISHLPPDLSTSLVRTVFGMFADPKVAATTKQNIRWIAPAVWQRTPEQIRSELGTRYAVYAANADLPRKEAAKEFLQIVGGLTYLPEGTLVIELNEKISNLSTAHNGFNNFHNEPAHAKALFSSLPNTGQVPDAVKYNYVKTLLMCFMGNGYGVSFDAYGYYEQLVGRFHDSEAWIIGRLMLDEEVASRLQLGDCARRFRRLIASLLAKSTDATVAAVLTHIQNRTDPQLSTVGRTTEFQALLAVKP